MLLVSALALAACDGLPFAAAPAPEETQPAPRADDPPPPREIVEPELSQSAVAQHFARLEEQRLSNGLLRRERSPRDLPFSARDVEDAFVRIALFEEYTFVGDRIVERATPSSLRRWQDPVRMNLEFGDSVPATIRSNDTRLVRDFAARLGRLTGHPVSLGGSEGNFHVLVLAEDERRAIPSRLRQLVPGIDPVTVDLVRDLPLGVSCLVLAFSRTGGDHYTDAIAVIRAELPDLSREACYFEELAQGMGLPNDHPRVRPSLFNDTAEFAVLTALDETLLRLLYDDRLRPGMREPEARPIIREIAAELMGGSS
ncbi:MAG: DUF2927 domain-containing protein [Rhodobacteraceae bacterium]|nr:DUF2927 domain-containing protein [Paracoccaceae bacterium]